MIPPSLPGPLEDGADGPLLDGPAAVLVLAVVQGLSEFLPISSSGHLNLGRALFGLEGSGLALDVALHLGTLLAVLIGYRRDVAALLVGVLRGRWRLALWLVLASVPAAAVGIGARDLFREAADRPRVAGVGLLVTAALLLFGERARRRAEAHAAAADGEPEGRPAPRAGDPAGPDEELRWSDALWMGAAQALAITPGVSRSGSTIAVGLWRGMEGVRAARLSFLMSLVAVGGAAAMELPDAVEHGFGDVGRGWVLAAGLVAGAVGWAALRSLLLVLRRGSLRWFALYCALLGTATLIVV